MNNRIRIIVGLAVLWITAGVGCAQAKFKLAKDDVVVFAGGTNMVQLQQAGHFEAILTHAFAQAKPKFRDVAWEADTVFRQGSVKERWRRDGFGDRDEQLKRLGTTVVIAQFGLLESMAGKKGLASFAQAYNRLIDSYQKQAKRVVLVSPTPFEKPSSPYVPDVSKHNKDLALYVQATAKIAAERNLLFIDLFTGAKAGLTDNGMHIKPEAQRQVAEVMARKLGMRPPTKAKLESLRGAVIEKHRLWYDYWRPANWKLLYGDDSKRQFTRGGKNYIPFKEEWRRLLPLIKQAERRVWQIAAGGKDPGHSRPKPEVLHGDKKANIRQELADFKTADGLKVNLFASEKQGLTSPLAIRWDTAGRAYVTVTTTYPHVFPGDVPNDKIIVLEDTNNDGQADKWIVFADGLNIPTGLELGDGGVYVGQSTEILFLKDTNGDGKADVRRVVLSGFGNGDSHQMINSFVWSPGGELYMGQGDGVESRVETPWGSSDLYQAGFYRFRPRRLQLDSLLDDWMGPANPWGVEFDNWGQIFTISGAGGVTYLSPGQIPTSHRLKLGEIGESGGYCGITYLDGRHLPKSMHGDFIVGDFQSNRVKRFSVKADGAGFKLEWKQPLLTSRHRNFRPIDVRVGPDGAVYVVDWYNPITCHQNDAYRDPRRDKAHGRIWRVASRSPTVKPPKLAQAPIKTVLDALKAPERWTRYQAKRELTRRDAQQVASALGAWVKTLDPRDKQHEHHLYEALGAYATIEVVEPGLLGRLLEAKDPRARAYAARVAGRWSDRLDQPLELLARRTEDQHPLVRMEAVAAAAAIPLPESIQVVARVVDQPMDKSLNYVFTQAVHHLRPHWEPAFKRGELVFAKPSHLAAVLNKAGGRSLIGNLKKLADSDRQDPKARSTAIVAILAVGGPGDLSEYGLNAKRFTRSGKYDAALHASVLAELIKVVQDRKVRPEGNPANALNRMIRHRHERLQANALTLAGLWQVKGAGGNVINAAANRGLPIEVRSAAFMAMARMDLKSAGMNLNRIAARPNSAPIRAAAIEALCVLDLGDAAKHAASLFVGVGGTTLNPSPVIRAFLSRDGGGAALAKALASVKMQPAFASHVLQSLYATGRNDEALIAVLKKSAGVSGTGQPYSEAYVRRLVADAKSKGNAKRGAMWAASCIACHKFGQVGGVIGPDLSSIGTTMSADRIIEELLWPSRQVKEGYTLLQVITKDGQVHQGFERRTKESERSGDLVMRQLAVDSLMTIRKDDIASKQEMGSAMPAGLTAGLTRQQLLDLIRYLLTLGGDSTNK